jgi:hypothetical protein
MLKEKGVRGYGGEGKRTFFQKGFFPSPPIK